MVEVVRGGPALQDEVLAALPEFWDGRDVAHLHHPVWFRQFGGAALAVRAADGSLGAYLLGCVTAEVAYVHLVAVRPCLRGRGVARGLYRVAVERATERGCSTIEAITTVDNSASVAFHRQLGFTTTLVRDYAGAGQDRVLFVRTTSSGSS